MAPLVELERAEDQAVGALMGKCHRSPFTGSINMNSGAFPDFSVVDLWTRDHMYGTVQDVGSDRFAFKPVPLGYRTWIYHYLYRSCKILPDAEESAVIKEVLSRPCIDAPVRAGRFSAMICYVPVAFGACITGSMGVVLATLMATILVYMITINANTPDAYRYDRIYSFPIRAGLAVYLLLWFLQEGLSGDIAFTIGGLVAVGFSIADIVAGDIGAIMAYRYHCTYEVIRSLPNRCLVCRRNGAADYESAFGGRGFVDQVVTGIGNWEKDMTLIADVNGLLVELRPMEYEDWWKMSQVYQISGKPESFVGMDVFSDECPCSDMVATGAEEIAHLAAKSRAQKKAANLAASDQTVVTNL